MKVGIDFDGTLIEKSEYPNIHYKLKPEAAKVVFDLANKGVQFEVSTARFGWYRIPAMLFIIKNKLPIKTHFIAKKPMCDYYIDDSNIECENKQIDWNFVHNKLLSLLEKEKNKNG